MKRTGYDAFGILMLCMVSLLSVSCATAEQLSPSQQSVVKENIKVDFEVSQNANTIKVSTSDPIVLRTFIMQGFSLIINGQYAYTVNVPSARSVENKISHHPGEVKATMQGNHEKRPDVRPVLEALNKVTVNILQEDKSVGETDYFNVSIEPSTGILTYVIKLPNEYSVDVPVKILLISTPQMTEGELKKGNFPNRNESERPQPFGAGQSPRPDDKLRRISIEYSFGE